MASGSLSKIPRAEHWAGKICAQLGKSVESILEIGRLLIAARAELVHGEWARLFSDELVPFSKRTADRLIAVAKHPLLSNGTHGSHLPPSWRTLYELSQVPDLTLKNAFRDGVITPDMPRKAVHGLVSGVKRERRYASLAETVWPDGKYGLILADPPWKPDDGVLDHTRQIENQYPTMTVDELIALAPAVRAHAADDCVLVMWATAQKLAEATAILAAWQFQVKSGAVWVKPSVGMGYWFRQRHELLILATSGTPATPLEADRPDSVIEASRRGHSEKPDELYGLLERMFPVVPKLEMFTRATRNGWAAMGNETQRRTA